MVRMDKNKLNKTRKKRVLKNPIKKWTLDETKLIVKYLQENQRVEKPSAQVYYKNLLEQHPEITASWDLIRYKVKNMRVAFMKARDWANGPGAKFRETDMIFFRERLHQICPFYEELDEIFGNIINCKVPRILCVEGGIQKSGVEVEVQQNEDVALPSSLLTESSSSPIHLAKKVRKLYKTSLNELYELQKERKEELREKLVFKERWKQADLELQQQKLKFEKEKFWEEMNLRRLEIQSRERIRQMEIEKEKYELDLKYKCVHNNEQ